MHAYCLACVCQYVYARWGINTKPQLGFVTPEPESLFLFFVCFTNIQ